MTCRVHRVFDDPTCIYCNAVASRETNEAGQWAAEETLRIARRTQRATLDAQHQQQRAQRAQQKAVRDARSADAARAFHEEQRQKKLSQKRARAATRAERNRQGALLLPKE